MRLIDLLFPREGIVTISNIWFGDRKEKRFTYNLPDGSSMRDISDHDYDLKSFNSRFYDPESFTLKLEDSFLKSCDLDLIYELPDEDNDVEDPEDSNYHYDWLAAIRLNAHFEHVPHDTAWELREFMKKLKESVYFHITKNEDRYSSVYFCSNAIHTLKMEVSERFVTIELDYQDQETLLDDRALFYTLAHIVH